MTRRDFIQDYAGIIALLKEHAYLRYSSVGKAEYEEKERSAIGYFLHLVYRCTGIDLPLPDFSLAELRPTDNPSLEGARAFMKRTTQELKKRALDPATPRRIEYEIACRAWLEALARLFPRGENLEGPVS